MSREQGITPRTQASKGRKDGNMIVMMVVEVGKTAGYKKSIGSFVREFPERETSLTKRLVQLMMQTANLAKPYTHGQTIDRQRRTSVDAGNWTMCVLRAGFL